MDIKLLSPSCWTDYELIDSGAFEKLERFGRYVIARPEPQAIWNKSLSDAEWQQRADAYFKKDKKSEDRGEWICKPKMPQQWFVNYRYGDMSIRMRLGLTSFTEILKSSLSGLYSLITASSCCPEWYSSRRSATEA